MHNYQALVCSRREQYANVTSAQQLDYNSMMKKTIDQPRLKAPGAGLPFLQRQLIQFWIGPVVSKRTPLTESRRAFESLSSKIVDRCRGIPVELWDTKVLVDPIIGLEDSSRHWSANEVLEHLMIVNRAIETVILTLASGRKMNATVDIAKLKPRGEKPTDPLREFEDYSRFLFERLDLELAQPGMNIHSTVSLQHPWFGPFLAKQWYWLLGSHAGIHYNQMKAIARELLEV